MDDEQVASVIKDHILSATQERQGVLIERLAKLVVSERGGPAEWLIGWIENDSKWTDDFL